MKTRLCILAALALLPFPSFAAESLKAKALEAWSHCEDMAQALAAVELYQQVCDAGKKDVESRIMLARATYWVIEYDEVLNAATGAPRLSNDKQAAIADQGIAACSQVLAMNENHPEGYYWLIWNMAAKTMARGLFSGFAFKDAVVGTIMISQTNVNYQAGGIYRYWARVIYEMPSLLGKFFHSTDEDTVWLYKKAIAIEPNYLRNHFWLAESYEKMGKMKEAKAEYLLIVHSPDTCLPGFSPENKAQKMWAMKKLEKM